MGDKEKPLQKKRGKQRRKAAETRHSGTQASSGGCLTSGTKNLPAWGCGLVPMAAFIKAS